MRVVAKKELWEKISDEIARIRPKQVDYIELTQEEIKELKTRDLADLTKDLPESYCGIKVIISKD
jgi:hypothetical protein